MTKEALAEKLNGREYTKEITRTEEQEAKASGLVVVFGASDDLCIFRGAIRDEVDCWTGGEIHLTREGVYRSRCSCDDCPYAILEKANTSAIKAIWDSESEIGYAWTYEAPFEVSGFDVREGGENYCRGIVFELASLPITKE